LKTQLRSSNFSAFAHPNFRLYFAGQLVSVSGTWMQTVAQGWLVFNLTQSELLLGIIACASGMPALLLSPFAGVIVDRFPRRSLLFVTQSAQMLLAFILSALAFAHVVQVWHVVILAFCLGISNAVDAPARQAFIVDMVGRDELTSGVSMNSLMVNIARIFGPSVAGITLAQFGAAWCFFINGVSFLAVIASLFYIHVTHPQRNSARIAPLQQLREGLRFARRHSRIAPLLLFAAASCLFTINVITLLPAFADKSLHSPIDGYAALATAQGVGAAIAGILFGLAAHRFGRGRVITVTAIFTPGMFLLMSPTNTVGAAVVFLGAASFGLILQFVAINTAIQTEVDDALRGRVVSLYTLTLFGLSPFGALALGIIADTIGTPSAMALYSLLGAALSLMIIARAPQMRSFQ
jgi:MFS family permease